MGQQAAGAPAADVAREVRGERIVHITTVHKPFDTRIHRKQCRTLAAAGYDVHLLASGVGPGTIEPFTTHPITARIDRPPLRGQPARQTVALRVARELGAELYHLHDPHLIPLGLHLKRMGARVVFDCHEHYPMKARARLAGSPVRRALKWRSFEAFEALAIANFDGFVCASDALANRFPADRTVTVNNFPSLTEFDRPPVRRPDDPPVVLYLGGMKRERGFGVLIRVPGRLDPGLGIRLRMMGELRPRSLADEISGLPWADRIELVGESPRAAVLDQLERASIGITVEPPRLNGFEGWRMNKLFEYMAAGLPVVIPGTPRWRRIVDLFDCGLVADADDPRSVAATVQRLVREPALAEELGRNGRRAIEEGLNWERQAPRLLGLYERLL